MEKVKLDNTQIPLHYQIADYLLEMVKRGDLNPEERLPPEEELREIFNVSRTTIRRALNHLLQRGLLYRKQGMGTIWTSSARTLKQEKLSGINREIFKITPYTSVKVLSRYTDKGNTEICNFLQLPQGSDVIVFKRLRFIENEPLSFTINYLPPRHGNRISKSHLREMTMLETLESVLKIELGIVEHEVEITRADAETAEALDIAVLDPTLTIKTSVFDTKDNPIEIVWTYFTEYKYKFRVVLDK
jgi:GntR family transcriptional regulator